MYYIAKNEQTVSVWKKVKRLGDFKPEEGVDYLVTTSLENLTLPIYVGLGGKLKKTKAVGVSPFKPGGFEAMLNKELAFLLRPSRSRR